MRSMPHANGTDVHLFREERMGLWALTEGSSWPEGPHGAWNCGKVLPISTNIIMDSYAERSREWR